MARGDDVELSSRQLVDNEGKRGRSLCPSMPIWMGRVDEVARHFVICGIGILSSEGKVVDYSHEEVI